MIDFNSLIPSFLLENDEFLKSVSSKINEYINDINNLTNYMDIMDNLDNLDEDILDKFATDRNIFWYDGLLPKSRKIAIIKSYKNTYRQLGTKQAVEQLIRDYFGGTGQVEEWYDYGGEHHNFKVVVRARGVPYSFVSRFIDALYWVKSADTWLEYIKFIQALDNNNYITMTNIRFFKKIYIEPMPEIRQLKGDARVTMITYKQRKKRRI